MALFIEPVQDLDQGMPDNAKGDEKAQQPRVKMVIDIAFNSINLTIKVLSPVYFITVLQDFRVTRIIRSLIALSIIAYSITTEACGILPRTTQIKINNVPVTVELAVSNEEKVCGLSFREFLSPDHGMLFVYSNDRMMTFWMKDTRIPLSIAFLDAKGVILNILEMEPMDIISRHRSTEPARYALEMSASWFAEHHIKPGDQFELHLPKNLD